MKGFAPMNRQQQFRAAALALACILGAPLAAHAADALRVVRDPVSGELRAPTAAEVKAMEKADAALRAMRKEAVRTSVERRYADGTVELVMGDDSMMYSVVSLAEDGSLVKACATSEEAAQIVQRGGRQSFATRYTAPAVKKVSHAKQ